MDQQKKHRQVLRAAFTKSANELDKLLSEEAALQQFLVHSLGIMAERILNHRLESLMSFVKSEVENEEWISLAAEGFVLNSEYAHFVKEADLPDQRLGHLHVYCCVASRTGRLGDAKGEVVTEDPFANMVIHFRLVCYPHG
ncbi:hypothetical protein JTB14_004619 [Gonioctena quinquepunctata]|nr:hypothetical protein JTB14_004619 [Gonioctena quinquepunctata]